MKILHRLKYRCSEPYRIKIGVGLSPVRSNREMKALIEFCYSELEDTEHMELNPERKRVYEMTVKLYEQGLSDDPAIFAKIHQFKPVKTAPMYNDVDNFIEDHVGWYWN